MEKTLDLLALLTCCFVFIQAKNKSQNFILKPHMDMLRKDLVYGGEKEVNPPSQMFIF